MRGKCVGAGMNGRMVLFHLLGVEDHLFLHQFFQYIINDYSNMMTIPL